MQLLRWAQSYLADAWGMQGGCMHRDMGKGLYMG